MNYLPATIRSTLSTATPFFKVSQPTLLPHLIKAAAATNMSLFFPIRHISSRPKIPRAPSKMSTTPPSTFGSSSSHSSSNDDGNHAQESRHDAHYRPSPYPNDRVKSAISLDDITRPGLRRLLHLTEACRLIEEEAHRNGQVLLDHMKEESPQETNTALGQQESTPSRQKEILLIEERERERREQIKKRSLADVLKNWELSEEGYRRLKEARRMRNELVHPVLRREDVVVILRKWK